MHAHAIFGQIACLCTCACNYICHAILPIWVSFNSSGPQEYSLQNRFGLTNSFDPRECDKILAEGIWETFLFRPILGHPSVCYVNAKSTKLQIKFKTKLFTLYSTKKCKQNTMNKITFQVNLKQSNQTFFVTVFLFIFLRKFYI